MTDNRPPEQSAREELLTQFSEQFESQWKDLPEPKVTAFLDSDSVRSLKLQESEYRRLMEILNQVDEQQRVSSSEASTHGPKTERFESTQGWWHPNPSDGTPRERGDPTVAYSDDDQLPGESSSNEIKAGRFGDYELIQEIARGGMGVVFKARQVKLNRIVALKMILAGQLASSGEVTRFYKEAESAARLEHPGIVPIFEVGQFARQHYFSMGYVDGGSLADRLRQAPMSEREAAQLMAQVADAVQYAHGQGIVHRDLKPGNILLTPDGDPKVTDFGLAARVEGEHELTATGQVIGTPGYMPPEQAAGEISEVGPRSDVYSLGAVLYRMLTGRVPFQGSNVVETIQQILVNEPDSVRTHKPGISRDLETICLKCLEKDPARRYHSAGELAVELRRFLAGEPIQARRIGPVARSWRWIRRKPLAAAFAASVCGLVLLVSLSVMVARNASATSEINRLNDQVSGELEHVELSENYLARVESLLNELELHAPSLSAKSRARLYDRFVEALRDEMRQPKLDEKSIRQLSSAIELLAQRRVDAASQLRQELEKRQSEFQPVAHLAVPYENLREVFGEAVLPVFQGQALVQRAQFEAEPNWLARVPSQVSSAGHVQIEATFGKDWEAQRFAGVTLNQVGQEQAYDFALCSTEHAADRLKVWQKQFAGRPPPRSFAEVRQLNGNFQVLIQRNQQTLLQYEVHHSQIPSGPLKIRAVREGGLLSIQIATQPVREFRDPFPLPHSRPGNFGVMLSGSLTFLELRASRKLAAESASSLERGDELFDRGNYTAALDYFRDQVRETDDVEFQQEAQYKRALCLLRLNRREEAAAQFAELLAQPQEHWPPRAGCQLWLLHLRERQIAKANEIYDLLSLRFRFQDIAALIPFDVRREILLAYRDKLSELNVILRYNPDLVSDMQRVAAIDRFLSIDGRGDIYTQQGVIGAYRMMGDLETALMHSTRMVAEVDNGIAARHHSALLRLTGQATRAQRYLDELYERSPNFDVPGEMLLRLERVRVAAALDDWQKCEEIVDEAFRIHREIQPISPDLFTYWSLIRGHLFQRHGATQQAQAIWREGYLAMKPDIRGYDATLRSDVVNMMILGSLSDSLAREDAQLFFGKLASTGSGGALLGMIQTVVSPDSVTATFRNMWRTPRGRKFAEDFAFEAHPLDQRVQETLALAGCAYLSSQALQGDCDPEQDELFFEAARLLYRQTLIEGKITATQAAQLSLTWRGTTNLLGWAGVAPSLEPDIRAPLAYIEAHRFLRLGQPEQSQKFFEIALADAASESLVARLATGDLELLRAQQGRLIVHSDLPQPIRVRVLKGNEKVAAIDVEDTEQLELPAGSYSLEIDSDAELRLSKTTVQIQPANRQIVHIEDLWHRPASDDPLPGLVFHPASRVVDGRWQVHPTLPTLPPTCLAWSPDGEQLALGDQLGTIWILNGQTLQVASVLLGHPRSVTSLAWDPRGERLVSTHSDRSAWVWEVSRGATLYKLAAQNTSDPTCAAWSHNGEQLAITVPGKGVRVWDRAGNLVHEINTPARMKALAWSPDDANLAACFTEEEGQFVGIWDMENGELLRRLAVDANQKETLTAVAWSPHGTYLAAGGQSKNVTVWSIADWQTSVIARSNPVIELGWLPQPDQVNEPRLVILDRQGLQVWDLSNAPAPLAESKLDSPVALDIASVGRIAILDDAGRLSIGDANSTDSTWQPDQTLEFPNSSLTALVASPDGKHLAIATRDGIVRIVSSNGELSMFRAPDGYAQLLSFSPEGKLACAFDSDTKAHILDLSGQEITALEQSNTGRIYGLGWSPAGQKLLIGSQDSHGRIWDVASGMLEQSFSTERRQFTQAAWSQQGTIVLRHFDGKLSFWNQPTDGTYSQDSMDIECDHVREFCFSPAGDSLLTTDSRGLLQRFGLDGKLAATFSDTTNQAHARFSADGQRILSRRGSEIRVWNPDGELVALHHNRAAAYATFNHTAYSVDRLASFAGFSHAPCDFVTSDNRGMLQFWNFDHQTPVATIGLLPQGESAVFAATGKLLSPLPASDPQFHYLVENGQGGMDLLSPADFHKKYKLTLPNTRQD